ncbi:MAG: hypothetical protein V3U03_17340 [Myxococcota bacterium]
MIEPFVQLTGFDELTRFLRKLPEAAAPRLQGALVKNHLEHRAEIVRSSRFSPRGTRNLKFAIRVFPSKRREVKKISDVEAGTSSFWKGADITSTAEGVAARLEKRIGAAITRPKRKRFLLIPWGDFLTATGRPRRERRDVGGRSVQAPILIRNLPGTRVVKSRDGKLRIVQRLQPGERGRFESGAKGTSKSKLGARERVVGILVRQVRVVRGLDFFGSWDRLAPKRNDRYDRLLNAILATKLLVLAAVLAFSCGCSPTTYVPIQIEIGLWGRLGPPASTHWGVAPGPSLQVDVAARPGGILLGAGDGLGYAARLPELLRRSRSPR